MGIEAKDVVTISEPDLVDIPGSSLRAVKYGGKIYTAVALKGFGNYPVRMFVLTKIGHAVGVLRVVGFADSKEILSVEGVDTPSFKGAIETEEGLVYVLDLESIEFASEPKVDIHHRYVVGESGVEEDTRGSFLIVYLGSDEVALRIEDVEGVLEWKEDNEFVEGNLVGFVSHSGNVITVVSEWDVPEPRWCVVCGEYAIPALRCDVVSGDTESGDSEEFLVLGEKRIPVIGEEYLERVAGVGSD